MGVRNPRPTPGPLAKGFSVRKISPHDFWLQKPARIELVEETVGAPSSSLKEPTYRLTYSDSLPLSSSSGVAA